MNTFVDFLRSHRKLLTLSLTALMLIVFIVYGFFRQQRQKEGELAERISRLAAEVENIEREEEYSLASEERLTGIGEELMAMYEGDPSLKNSLRALFILAKIDYRKNKVSQAREKYLKIAEESPYHYLAPQALLYAALAWEEEGRFEEAVKLLQSHERDYYGHFTQGEAMLSLARNLQLQKRYQETLEVLNAILKNQDIEIQHEKAQEQIDLMKMKGLIDSSQLPSGSIPNNRQP